VKKYEILEHKADLKIKAFGKDKKELFSNAMIGMFESAKYESQGKEIKREIKVSSIDLPSLLVDFLSEILYLSEVNQEVYQKIQFRKFTDKNINGILIGKKLKRIGVVIKGVTYHDLDIHQKPERSEGWRRTNVLRLKDKTWEAIILFDI